jgi:hypothetical protein
MRLASQKKLSGFQDRAERLRQGRAAAPPLRELSPGAAQIAVHLQFLSEGSPRHAEQSFVFYPAARAFFGFPCPYGDCNGIYDLSGAASSTLGNSQSPLTGTLECSGERSRYGMSRQLCGLQVSYTVTAQHRLQVQHPKP